MSKYLGGLASSLYGQPGTSQQTTATLIPRMKYQFVVSALLADSSNVDLTRIVSIDMPGHTVKNAVLNQYNKKRIIQTGVDYNPINLVAYDTRDGALDALIQSYHAYYYAGVTYADNNTVVKHMIDDLNTGDPGFTLGNSETGLKLTSDRSFFKQINIIRRSSDEDVSVITLYNPYIVSIDADTLDYSASAAIQYRIQFAYEGYSLGAFEEPKNRPTDNTNPRVPEPIPAKGSTQAAADPSPVIDPGFDENFAGDVVPTARSFGVGESTTSQTGNAGSLTPGPITTGNTRFEEEVLRNGLNGAL